MHSNIDFLKVAGILSFLTAALHIAIIFGGPEWYRFFGAGQDAAIQAEQGSIRLILSTLFLAAIFSIWGLYAWSGSGILPRFPFLRTCLILITIVYLARGIVGFIIPFVTNHPRITQLSISFMMWSSFICLCFGLVHLKGILDRWSSL
jgi:putative oxidoreductase